VRLRTAHEPFNLSSEFHACGAMPREVRKALARFDAAHVPCFMIMTFMLMTFMLMTFMTVTFMTRPAGLGHSPSIRSWAGAAGHWACHLACPIEKPCKVYTAGASGVVEQIPHCHDGTGRPANDFHTV
jgi:hypothetical protein